MAGYTRFDVTDQIANGNTVDAIPLDGEFNALQGAFASTGGHKHDGSAGEGAPITTIGPTQDVVISGNSITPKTDNTVDLGSSTLEWKNLYIDGVANIDSLVADTADINAGTIDGTVIGGSSAAAITGTTVTATDLVTTTATVGGVNVTTASNTQTLTNKTINLTNNTLAATSAQLAASVSDETGSGALVFASSPTLSGVPTAPTAAANTNTTQIATTAHVFAERSNAATLTNKTMTSPIINTATITGGTVSGITDLSVADGGTGASDAAGALLNFGLTATAAELNTLDGITASTAELNILDGVTASAAEINILDGLTASTAELNFVDGVTSSIQTQLDALSAAGLPSGSVIYFAANTAPSGFLKANGANVSRTTYATLFAAIGTTFGVGDGSTTFTLPDLRGEFLRGWDDGRGVDTGRAFGSLQSQAIESHTHTGSTSTDGAHTHTVSGVVFSSDSVGTTDPAGNLPGTATTSSAGAHSHTLTINAAGGTETRPRNIALLACIKF